MISGGGLACADRGAKTAGAMPATGSRLPSTVIAGRPDAAKTGGLTGSDTEIDVWQKLWQESSGWFSAGL